LEVWVNADAEGQWNFRNLEIPKPDPDSRILFGEWKHVGIPDAKIHFKHELHNLSGEASDIWATIDDSHNVPATSWKIFELSAKKATFAFDDRRVNNIDIRAHGWFNDARVEVQELTLRSLPLGEARLEGALYDWSKFPVFKYDFNVTSTVDLAQTWDILQKGPALSGKANFQGKITGEGTEYQIDGSANSADLTANGVRLQGLNVNAKGPDESYRFNGQAVAKLLTAGDFTLNTVQLTGGVMGTGSDLKWLGELQVKAAEIYGTTIVGLIFRDAKAEYHDGVFTASAPQFTGRSLSSTSGAKLRGGIEGTRPEVRYKNGETTVTIARVNGGKLEVGKDTIDGFSAKNITAKSSGKVADVTVQDVQVGAIS